MTVAAPADAGSRRDRSQPALRLPGGSTPAPPDSRGLTRLADLVEAVVACLDLPVDEPLHAVVAECNAELEACLEVEREHEPTAASAQDELRWLVRQLRSERADTTLVMRRIRRVLGRVDAHRRPGAGPE